MKRSKNKLSVIPLVFLLSVVLAGCSIPQLPGGTDANNDSKITLTLWYRNGQLDDHLLAEASKQFPHIHINALKIGGSYDAKLRVTLAGQSNIPDLVTLNSNIATYFPDADQFVNLLTLGAGDIKSEYLGWKWHLATTPDGRVIALPIDTGPMALFYRADLFQQAGLPGDPRAVAARLNSWDAYMQAGEQLQNALHGKAYMFDDVSTVFDAVVDQNPLQYFDEANNYIGGQSHIKRAWDYAARVYQSGLTAKVVEGTTEWNEAVSNGSVASFVGASWMAQKLMQGAQATTGKWRVTQAPGGAGNNGGSFLAITRASAHPREAYEIIKWLLSPTNQTQSYLDNSLFPSTPASYSDVRLYQPNAFFGGEKIAEMFSQAAEQINSTYLGPEATVVGNALHFQLSLIEAQNKNPETAWNDAQHEIQRQLSH